jgi:hypothetical protein
MSMGSLSKAIGPFSGSILLAWSLNSHLHFPLDGHFTFLVISLLGLLAANIPLHTMKSPDDSSIELSPTRIRDEELTYAALSTLDLSHGKVKPKLEPKPEIIYFF